VVLVVDDDDDLRAAVRYELEEDGYLVIEAADGYEAINRCSAEHPDIILLDAMMPKLDGYGLLRHVKQDPSIADIPVVFMTGHDGTDAIVYVLTFGAHDYLVKPVDPSELRARVGAAVRIKKLQDHLRQANKDLERISRVDPLTGLRNRRDLEAELRLLSANAQRYELPIAALMVDIDHFKRVNDTFGHQVGDEVLADVARRLSSVARRGDLVGRWGGEEFLVILPMTSHQGARMLAERMRVTVGASPVRASRDGGVPVTVSIGCAGGDHDTVALIARADGALYDAKRGGRNAVVVAASSD
jgi:two-component system, cell cycle response regulator